MTILHPRFRFGLAAFRGHICARVVALVPLFMGTASYARTDLTVTGNASVKAATNPFLLNLDDAESTAVSASLSPSLDIVEAAGKVSLAGTVRHTEYFRRYDSSQSASGGARGEWRLDPRTTMTAGLSFSSSITGENALLETGLDGRPLLPDITLTGFAVRQRQFGTRFGVAHEPNARTRLSIDWFATASKYGGAFNGNDYATYGQSVLIDNRISDDTSLGGSLDLSKFECRSGNACSAVVVQPQAVFSTTLAERWTLRAQGGVSINKLRYPGDFRTLVSPAGSISLCQKDPRTDVCISASKSVTQTALTGPSSGTSFSASVQHRLNDRENVGLAAGYSETGGDRLVNDRYRYWNVRMNGNSRIARNTGLTVEGAYFNSDSPIRGRRSNFEVSVGVSFTLGRNT